MACAAENLKAVWGGASRHTCNASPAHYNLDRPKFFVPTRHHTGERWKPADFATQHPRECSSGRPHLRHLRIGQSPLSMKHGDEIGRAAYYLRSCFRTNVPQDQRPPRMPPFLGGRFRCGAKRVQHSEERAGGHFRAARTSCFRTYVPYYGSSHRRALAARRPSLEKLLQNQRPSARPSAYAGARQSAHRGSGVRTPPRWADEGHGDV